MDEEFFDGFFCILDGKDKIMTFQITGIAYLAAGFTVKRRCLDNNFRFLPFGQGFDYFTVNDNGADLRIGQGHSAVAAEFRGDAGTGQLQIAFSNGFLTTAFPCTAGSLPLLFHFGLKSCRIQGEAVALDNVRRQIGGKSEGVVELENERTGKNILSGAASTRLFLPAECAIRHRAFP